MIVKEIYFYIVEMIPKHNAQDIDKCIGAFGCLIRSANFKN